MTNGEPPRVLVAHCSTLPPPLPEECIIGELEPSCVQPLSRSDVLSRQDAELRSLRDRVAFLAAQRRSAAAVGACRRRGPLQAPQAPETQSVRRPPPPRIPPPPPEAQPPVQDVDVVPAMLEETDADGTVLHASLSVSTGLGAPVSRRSTGVQASYSDESLTAVDSGDEGREREGLQGEEARDRAALCAAALHERLTTLVRVLHVRLPVPGSGSRATQRSMTTPVLTPPTLPPRSPTHANPLPSQWSVSPSPMPHWSAPARSLVSPPAPVQRPPSSPRVRLSPPARAAPAPRDRLSPPAPSVAPPKEANEASGLQAAVAELRADAGAMSRLREGPAGEVLRTASRRPPAAAAPPPADSQGTRYPPPGRGVAGKDRHGPTYASVTTLASSSGWRAPVDTSTVQPSVALRQRSASPPTLEARTPVRGQTAVSPIRPSSGWVADENGSPFTPADALALSPARRGVPRRRPLGPDAPDALLRHAAGRGKARRSSPHKSGRVCWYGGRGEEHSREVGHQLRQFGRLRQQVMQEQVMQGHERLTQVRGDEGRISRGSDSASSDQDPLDWDEPLWRAAVGDWAEAARQRLGRHTVELVPRELDPELMGTGDSRGSPLGARLPSPPRLTDRKATRRPASPHVRSPLRASSRSPSPAPPPPRGRPESSPRPVSPSRGPGSPVAVAAPAAVASDVLYSSKSAPSTDDEPAHRPSQGAQPEVCPKPSPLAAEARDATGAGGSPRDAPQLPAGLTPVSPLSDSDQPVERPSDPISPPVAQRAPPQTPARQSEGVSEAPPSSVRSASWALPPPPGSGRGGARRGAGRGARSASQDVAAAVRAAKSLP
eukprot:Hpha_TRINITY_DN1786_c0_g1::TRINITY_DN1786_c0_g1_i1::g.158362::m.158362